MTCTRHSCTYPPTRASLFRDYEAFLGDMEEMVSAIKASGDNVLMPGEREHTREEEVGGVIVLDEEMNRELSELAGDTT
jgi:LDH2 family malate/lactate/ureidoglycolate dehydrogenase